MFTRPSLDASHIRVSPGFTLIEILLVVTIMAILTVSGLRGIVNIQRSARVNDMYSRFVSFLDLARSYSLNGRQVTFADKSQKVPKSFGVALVPVTQPDKACPTSTKKIVQFFFENDTPPPLTATSPNILDSYCLHPQVAFDSGVNGPTQFLYTTPFGEFSYPGITPKNTTPLSIQFCDGTSCTNTALSKTVTLYSNVGVPE